MFLYILLYSFTHSSVDKTVTVYDAVSILHIFLIHVAKKCVTICTVCNEVHHIFMMLQNNAVLLHTLQQHER